MLTGRKTPLNFGEPAPWFEARVVQQPLTLELQRAGGRHVALCFVGSAGDALSAQVMAGWLAHAPLFEQYGVELFCISAEPADARSGQLATWAARLKMIADFDHKISAAFGLLGEGGRYQRLTYLLDTRLRVMGVLPFKGDASQHVAGFIELLRGVPAPTPPTAAADQAPVLVVPRVFEPALCRLLIDAYEQGEHAPSGFMVEVDGKTVLASDTRYKRRRDHNLKDEALRNACSARIHDRLVPELQRAFQFSATRIERYIVACYDAADQGHFSAHRDNTTLGTAHRRFAVSLFLNSGEFDGGQLWFPEYGSRRHIAPAGGAVVFSCSLLHEATPVTRGRRYMFLPFLYDEAGAVIRQQNRQHVQLD